MITSIVVWGAVIAFALALTMLYAATLRYGPRRGYWSQPAAKLRRPGNGVVVAIWVVAAIHVVLGTAVMLSTRSSLGVGVFFITLGMAAIYAMFALCMQIASIANRRKPERVIQIASGGELS